MSQKKFHVEFFFPHLPFGIAQQNVRGVEATNMGMAVHKAFKEVKGRKGVKGRKHLDQVKITVIEIVSRVQDATSV